jgi:hypothetical protein
MQTPSLSAQLPLLHSLASIRTEVASLRRGAALGFESAWAEATEGAKVAGYIAAGDDIELASCLIALISTHGVTEDLERHLRSKREVKARLLRASTGLEAGCDSQPLRRFPILSAARLLSALSQMPLNGNDSVEHAKAMLLSYYLVRMELNSAVPPMRMVGAARAEAQSAPSAFITGECTRAMHSLANSLASTASLIDVVCQYNARIRELDGVPDVLVEYRAVEAARLRAHYAGLAQEHAKRSLWRPEDNDGTLNTGKLLAYSDALVDLKSVLSSLLIGATDAENSIPRDSPNGLRTESHEYIGFWKARETIRGVKAALASWRDICRTEPQQVADAIRLQADLIRGYCSGPPARFLIQRLYREVSRHTDIVSHSSLCDYPEMIFAAAAVAAIGTTDVHRALVKRACSIAAEAMAPDGSIPHGRPIAIDASGNALLVLNAEVLRCLLQAWGAASPDPEVEVGVMTSILSYFRIHMRRHRSGAVGWVHEYSEASSLADGEASPGLWVTAIALTALARMEKRLDERINTRVLAALGGRQCARRKSLNDVIWPDVGRAAFSVRVEARQPHVVIRSPAEGFAETLPGLITEFRSHLGGSARARRCSAVLYGPPGTGKTHILEVLAEDAESGIVEITPSNLLVGGEAEVERRAQEVFDALCMLRKCVIVFDEFERVLFHRATSTNADTNVFSFLTASMLPKLKRLHTAAERGSLVYALLTNRVTVLDKAAIRSGRFDGRIGVFYPDPVARLARLWRLAERCEWEGGVSKKTTALMKVAKITKDYTMEVLGRVWGKDVKTKSSSEFLSMVTPRSDHDAEWEELAGATITIEAVEAMAMRLWNDKFDQEEVVEPSYSKCGVVDSDLHPKKAQL